MLDQFTTVWKADPLANPNTNQLLSPRQNATSNKLVRHALAGQDL